MGLSLSADQRSYELVREYAHRSRKKMIDVVSECIAPLADRLEAEHGIRFEVSRKPANRRKKGGKQ